MGASLEQVLAAQPAWPCPTLPCPCPGLQVGQKLLHGAAEAKESLASLVGGAHGRPGLCENGGCSQFPAGATCARHVKVERSARCRLTSCACISLPLLRHFLLVGHPGPHAALWRPPGRRQRRQQRRRAARRTAL